MTQQKTTSTVRKRPLGTTGLMVSELSLGCVKFGRTEGLKHPGEFSLPDDNTINALLACAREHGINLLDTAPAYGTSEERLGALLPGNRQDWVLSSKAGEIFTQGKSRFDFHPDAVQRSLEQSLQRLRTDYLDLFLLHSDGNDTSLMAQADLVARLQDLKAKGLIRAHGISVKSNAGLLSADGVLDVVMLEPGHIMGKEDELPSGKTGLLFKKILASGHETPVQHRRLLKQRFRDCLAAPGAASIIVGTLSITHLKENIALASQTDRSALYKESGSI